VRWIEDEILLSYFKVVSSILDSMSLDLLLILAVVVLGFISLYFLLRNLIAAPQSSQDLDAVVNKVFGMSIQKVTEQSKEVLKSEREAIAIDLDNKQKSIEKLVKQLQDDMAVRQREIRDLEQDRVKTFSHLSSQLQQQKELSQQLQISTEQLSKVLSNNQARGAWGERIIEDLMTANGLTEGVHFQLQAQLSGGAERPDVILLLPNKRIVPVDVKFPYAAIQKMAATDDAASKEAYLKQFGQDLKIKIKKVATYISPDNNTLDYAIMFVPNEMIFSFINQKFSDLVDDAIRQRVILVSPLTFIALARMVLESYRNFMLEDRLREVVQHVEGFTKEWSLFKEQFDKYGRALDTLKKAYEDLTGTRVRKMDMRISKIQQSQVGVIGETLQLEE